MKMFGSMGNLLGMIPGLNLGKDDRDLISNEADKQFKRFEVFIQSMTPEERRRPDIINTSRKKRIATGCGMNLQEVNQFITQFNQTRAMMSGMNSLKKMFTGGNGEMPNMHGKQGRHAMKKAMSMMRKFK